MEGLAGGWAPAHPMAKVTATITGNSLVRRGMGCTILLTFMSDAPPVQAQLYSLVTKRPASAAALNVAIGSTTSGPVSFSVTSTVLVGEMCRSRSPS